MGVRCVVGKDFTVIFGALKGQVIRCITLLVEGTSGVLFVFKDAVNRSDNGGRAIIWPLSTGSADSRLADNSESVIRLYTSRELLTAREPVGDWSTVYFGGSGISVWVRVH